MQYTVYAYFGVCSILGIAIPSPRPLDLPAVLQNPKPVDHFTVQFPPNAWAISLIHHFTVHSTQIVGPPHHFTNAPFHPSFPACGQAISPFISAIWSGHFTILPLMYLSYGHAPQFHRVKLIGQMVYGLRHRAKLIGEMVTR